MSDQTITLSKDFGYVIAVAAASGIVVWTQGFPVMPARKAAKVEYPHFCVYPIKTNEERLYMCAQRAHYNTLEGYPGFLASLLGAGILYPKTAAGLGVGWLVGRVSYGIGYRTGEPSKRNNFGTLLAYLSLFSLVGMGVVGGIKKAAS